MPVTTQELTTDPVAEAADAMADLALRGCLGRPPKTRERLAQHLYDRLHPLMAALGILFLVLVLAQGPAREGTQLQQWLLAGTWALWAVFVTEYLLRLVIAPDKAGFVRRTWWQVVFLAVPFLATLRLLLALRAARATRVAVAAFRGSRSTHQTMAGRTTWLAVVTSIVVFGGADILYTSGGVHPYGRALHAAALASITGEPTQSPAGIGQLLDVVLAVYAVVFFASLAGILGSFFVEQRRPPA